MMDTSRMIDGWEMGETGKMFFFFDVLCVFRVTEQMDPHASFPYNSPLRGFDEMPGKIIQGSSKDPQDLKIR